MLFEEEKELNEQAESEEESTDSEKKEEDFSPS